MSWHTAINDRVIDLTFALAPAVVRRGIIPAQSSSRRHEVDGEEVAMELCI